MYGKEQLQKIKVAAGIHAYEKRLIDLKGGGKKYKACCPFHSDKTPSLSVYQKDQIWHWKCFGCEKGGDIFNLVQELDKVDFVDAVKRVGKECGITLEEEKVHFKYDREAATARLAEAKDYLASRGIPFELAAECGLGVVDFPGMGPSLAIPYNEDVVKFRALQQKEFRHLPGHPSGHLLYGLDRFDWLSQLVDPDIYVTESELDALTMAAQGFNAVSVTSAGSVIDSEGKAKVGKENLDKLCEAERIFLALDMDAAGQRCAEAFEKALPPYKTRRLTWHYGGKESADPKDIGEIYTKAPGEFASKIRALAAAADEPAKRLVFVYSDLPRAGELAKEVYEVDWLVHDLPPLNRSS